MLLELPLKFAVEVWPSEQFATKGESMDTQVNPQFNTHDGTAPYCGNPNCVSCKDLREMHEKIRTGKPTGQTGIRLYDLLPVNTLRTSIGPRRELLPRQQYCAV